MIVCNFCQCSRTTIRYNLEFTAGNDNARVYPDSTLRCQFDCCDGCRTEIFSKIRIFFKEIKALAKV